MPIPAYDPQLIHPLLPVFVPVEIAPTTWTETIASPSEGTYPVKKGTERRQRLKCQIRRAQIL